MPSAARVVDRSMEEACREAFAGGLLPASLHGAFGRQGGSISEAAQCTQVRVQADASIHPDLCESQESEQPDEEQEEFCSLNVAGFSVAADGTGLVWRGGARPTRRSPRYYE